MPLKVPPIDDRSYEELLGEALARIPVHTPEWTNFNKSDPGVTLIEVFAFLTDSLLYRARQIPERNRLKFLSLLGLGLQPSSCARGIVAFTRERGQQGALYLGPGLELGAGKIPFRTERGVHVLPVEAQVYYKRQVTLDKDTEQHYADLYKPVTTADPGAKLSYYVTTPLPPPSAGGVSLEDAIDHCLWIALLAPPREDVARAREAIAGRPLSVGVVPAAGEEGISIGPGTPSIPESPATWRFDVARLVGGGAGEEPELAFQLLAGAAAPAAPAVLDVLLPDKESLAWTSPGPLRAGVEQFPPSLEDKEQDARLIAWIRVQPSTVPRARILWVGINAAMLTQRAQVRGERLPEGTGEPDQAVTLANRPVLRETVRVTVDGVPWARIDDLFAAGPEIAAPDPRLPPGAPSPAGKPSRVFQVDPESGEIRFGDGLRGARPPRGAALRADYDHGHGADGNVGAGAIKGGPALPSGVKVQNPVPTWGGVDAETARDGERQIARHLQHRDRLVTASDFEAITLRAPGVSIGRVDVLPAYHPDYSLDDGVSDAPGAVTLLILPASDPARPEAPLPDQPFLRAIADHLEQRRMLTTEIVLRGPTYKPVWVSLGIRVVPGASVADVLVAVERAVRRFLSPLPGSSAALEDRAITVAADRPPRRQGWPLRQAVLPQEVAAVASRVDGVAWIEGALVGSDDPADKDLVALRGLELPQLAALSVSAGPPRPLQDLRGEKPAQAQGERFVPVPVVPEVC